MDRNNSFKTEFIWDIQFRMKLIQTKRDSIFLITLEGARSVSLRWKHYRDSHPVKRDRFSHGAQVLAHPNPCPLLLHMSSPAPTHLGKSMWKGNGHHCNAAGSGEKALSLLLLHSAQEEQVFSQQWSQEITWVALSPAGLSNLRIWHFNA